MLQNTKCTNFARLIDKYFFRFESSNPMLKFVYFLCYCFFTKCQKTLDQTVLHANLVMQKTFSKACYLTHSRFTVYGDNNNINK